MAKKTDNSFHFRGKSVFSNDRSELLTLVKNQLSGSKPVFFIFTPNPEQLMLAERDANFSLELQAADLLLPDGVGLIWASKILATPTNPSIKERLPGRLVVKDLLQIAKDQRLTTLVIGGRDYADHDQFVVDGTICHWTEGYIDANNPTDGEEVALAELLAKIKPGLVFVAFGAPLQERWLLKHRQLLNDHGVKIGMVVGGTFDYLLNKVPTPPNWVAKMGLEWLFRLITQPHRLGRQLRLIEFVFLVLEEKWQNT